MGRMSALHLFRKQYIAGKERSEGSWCSKEAWEEVRNAYNMLPPERQAIFEKEQKANVDHEKSLPRRQQSLMPLVVSTKYSAKTSSNGELGSDIERLETEKANEPPTVAGTNCAAPILTNLLPADFDKLVAATSSLEDLSNETNSCAADFVNSSDTTFWPVEESNVLACLAATQAKGMTLRGACKEFYERCQVIAGPEQNQEEFPASVTIHGMCGALCQLEHSAKERLLYGQIVDALEKTVSFDKPTKVVQSDVLIACLVECGSDKILHYFFITAISGKGGYNKPDAVHVFCKLVSHNGDDDFATRYSIGAEHVLVNIRVSMLLLRLVTSVWLPLCL